MRIPLVDLSAQYDSIKPEIDSAIGRVLEHKGFILGQEVEEFEASFAHYVGAEHAVGVASGTAALHLALLACGVGPGDEVITTAHTFVATAEAIVHAGARPVFVDIDPVTYNVDPNHVEAAVTPRTRAMLPVHLYGQPADMDALREIARRHDLRIVEDAAQAHGAEYRGKRCGGIGDLACFSFYPGKNLGAYGDGGIVTGNDETLVERVRKLRDHGRTSKYLHEELGFGERLDALQAAILRAKLPYLEAWTEARRAHAHRYKELLDEMDLLLPGEQPETRHVYHLFVLRTRLRDVMLTYLKERAIGVGLHYPIPLHRQPAFEGLCDGGLELPVTEQVAAEVISLPMYPELTEAQIAYVADKVKEFMGQW
jgi:dTDP-4-amino-4,6-dideoxygalactose transaminase